MKTSEWSSERRSKVMALIKSKDTKPELRVRSLLHRLGFRFTVNGPANRQLQGKPDIVLPRYSTVIFVHGCFWHAHPRCKVFKLPRTRAEWWKEKLERNRQRDRKALRTLRKEGWNALVIWECETTTRAALEKLAARLPARIHEGAQS